MQSKRESQSTKHVQTYNTRNFQHEALPTRGKPDTKNCYVKQGQHFKWAIPDSEATSNFLMPGAHTFSSIPIKNPISVTLPDGNKVRSTHQCSVDLPRLQKQAREGHVILVLTSHSLM